MKYSKRYLKEKWESIKNDMENILLNKMENDYVDFPEGRGIRENIKDKLEAIKTELGI